MKKKILLIEDSQIQQKTLLMSLSKLGHEIITANNGIEGIKAAFQLFPDLIVSDIIMPEINGYQLCRLLKNDDIMRAIPIILLTNLNEKIDNFWGLRTGANCFLTKEKDMNHLNEEVEKLLENAPLMSEDERKSFVKEHGYENINIQLKINEILDQALVESTVINEFRTLSEFISTTKILSKEVLSLIFSILDFNVACVFFNERDDKKKKVLNLGLQGVKLDEQTFSSLKKDSFSIFSPEDFFLDETMYSYEIIEESNGDCLNISNLGQFKSKVIIPITYGSKILGGIALYSLAPNSLRMSKIFNIILNELKVLMRIKWLYSETKYLSLTDGLTNLYNRRYFQQALDREFGRAKRYNEQLSLAMFDIDHFKNINDSYGHQFGDKVIAEVAQAIKSALRKTDYVARYGGEEIVIILPETDTDQTYFPVERIRKKIEQRDFMYRDKPVKVTVSVGIASLSADINGSEELISRADQALYAAKDKGRNRVEFYTNNSVE